MSEPIVSYDLDLKKYIHYGFSSKTYWYTFTGYSQQMMPPPMGPGQMGYSQGNKMGPGGPYYQNAQCPPHTGKDRKKLTPSHIQTFSDPSALDNFWKKSVATGEIALHEKFLLLPQCFQFFSIILLLYIIEKLCGVLLIPCTYVFKVVCFKFVVSRKKWRRFEE